MGQGSCKSSAVTTSRKALKLTLLRRFTMPTTAPSPLTSYLHGGLLEEGCVHISKTTLEKEEPVTRHTKCAPSSMDEDSSDAESVEEDDADHPSLRMQWNWTELKADKKG